MSRRYVTIYLGDAEKQALTQCPPGTKRGQWINHLAGQLATWHPDQWSPFLSALAPRPRPRRGKLSVALPAPLAADLDARRGHVSLADILRTALLRAAGVAYAPIPSLPPPDPTAGPGIPAPANVPAIEASVREPVPGFAINPNVVLDEGEGPQVSWQHEDADDEAVAEIQARFRREKPRGEACYPDMTPQAQAEVATEILNASVGASFGCWIGVRHSYDHIHTFTGLEDPAATRGVFDEVVTYCERSAQVKFTTYSLGPEPQQVLLHAEVKIEGRPPRRVGDVQIVAKPEDARATEDPSVASQYKLDVDRLDKLARRAALTLSELSAVRGEFHEYRDTEDERAAALRTAVEALLARVEDLEEQLADHEEAFQTLVPLLDRFKLKWRG